jgi:hypothetical protein
VYSTGWTRKNNNGKKTRNIPEWQETVAGQTGQEGEGAGKGVVGTGGKKKKTNCRAVELCRQI